MSFDSPAVVVSTCVASLAMVYGFVCDVQQQRLARPVRDRIRETHPDVWAGLSWFQRHAAPNITVMMLVRRKMIMDPDFLERSAGLVSLARKKNVAYCVGAAFIAFVLLATAA